MQANNGDRVKVHYILRDADGKEVETSHDAEPMEFTIGEGRVIHGFEKGVTGMSENETKTITIPPEDAYGSYDKGKIFEFSRKNAPGDFDPQIGQPIKMHRPDGKSFVVTVLSKTSKGFMMDANHPLSGKELTFELHLVEIIKAGHRS